MGFVRRQFLWGFVLGLSLAACGSIPVFPYKYYNLSGNRFEGTLLGQKPGDDIPFSKCEPVNGTQQCAVVLYPALNALVIDYKQCKSDLISCQKGQ